MLVQKKCFFYAISNIHPSISVTPALRQPLSTSGVSLRLSSIHPSIHPSIHHVSVQTLTGWRTGMFSPWKSKSLSSLGNSTEYSPVKTPLEKSLPFHHSPPHPPLSLSLSHSVTRSGIAPKERANDAPPRGTSPHGPGLAAPAPNWGFPHSHWECEPCALVRH